MSNPKEPRSAIIFEHTRKAFRHSSLTEQEFTAALIEHYHETVDLRWRCVNFRLGGDPYKSQKLNAQLMRRFYNGDVRMPADLEEAWIAALPNPWRQDCRRELAARIGRMDVRIPVLNAEGGIADAARLMQEVGEALQALAPVLEPENLDREAAAKAVQELADVRSVCITLQQRIADLLGDSGNVQRLGNAS